MERNKLTLRGLTVKLAEREAQLKAATAYSDIRRYCKKSAEVIVNRKRAVCQGKAGKDRSLTKE